MLRIEHDSTEGELWRKSFIAVLESMIMATAVNPVPRAAKCADQAVEEYRKRTTPAADEAE